MSEPFRSASGSAGPATDGDADSAPLVVRTVRIEDAAPLLSLLPDAPDATAWVRRGEGLVGCGVAAVCRTSGPDRFTDAKQWWAEHVRTAVVRDEVDQPGTGVVCFGSFGFADGAMSGTDWVGVVAEAVRRIGDGELEKVVLARDMVATADEDIDVRWPLHRLAASYPMCWTFHVDGLFGATPEMLVRRERGLVTSRVLAGTIRRTGDDARDLALAATLARSSKDLEEHEYAVRSVADALAPHCSSMNVPESPFVLHLPNVMHLATDVAGVGHDAADPAGTSLDLATALHPSAAVGGTPTDLATALITEIEGMDRGRYAGPVGWMDASGDGEWGIALRSAMVVEGGVRLFAGCGIVAESDPESELAEAQAKFVPVRDSLAGMS